MSNVPKLYRNSPAPGIKPGSQASSTSTLPIRPWDHLMIWRPGSAFLPQGPTFICLLETLSHIAYKQQESHEFMVNLVYLTNKLFNL